MGAKRKYTNDQELDMVAMYNSGTSTVGISAVYPSHDWTISSILKRHGVKIRSRSEAGMSNIVDDLFFEVIDTEAKAWCLGIMFSDGCVCGSNNSINLEMCDLDVVEKFKNAIGSTAPIRSYKRKDCKITYSVSNYSAKIKQDLIRHGCTPRKSNTLQFPTTVPDDLMRHFIRGYFDGDGGICYKGKYSYACITGTESVLNGIMAIMIDKTIITSKRKRNHTSSTYEMRISHKSLSKFYDLIYSNSTIRMDRKFMKMGNLK